MSVLATDGLVALFEGPSDGLVTLFIEGPADGLVTLFTEVPADGLVMLFNEVPADGLVMLFTEGLIGVEGLVIVALVEFLMVDGVADAVILVVFLDPA